MGALRLFLLGILLPAWAQASVCDFLSANARGQLEGPGPKQRAKILCGLRTALIEKYSLLDWKRETLGIDAEKQLNACVKRELFGSGDEWSQIEFEDRLLKCLAPFQDTHLRMTSQTERPKVYAGFQIEKVGGRAIITAVNKTIQATWPESIRKLVQPGAVVESLDGESLEALTNKLALFISGSSKAFVQETAIESSTFRNFALPRRASLKVKLAGSEAFELPWWSIGLNQRADTRRLFERIGIKSAHSLALDIDQKIRNAEDTTGFTSKTPLLPAESLTTFFDDKGKPGLRMGEFEQDGRPYCYIQLLTFGAKRWHLGKPGGRAFPFEFPLAQHLTACRLATRPLVIDLRWNDGGDSAAPAQVLALLAKGGESYPSALVSGRLTTHFRMVLEKYELGDGFPARDMDTSQGRMKAALAMALEHGSEYLPFVAAPNIVSTLEESSYDLPVAALISPFCVSACDLMAALLRNSKRATLIGSQTNGTGGRYMELGEGPLARWSDETYGTVTVAIPNSIHAVLSRTLKNQEWFFAYEEHKAWMMENRPIGADIRYATGEADFELPGQGWRKAAVEALSR